MIKYLCQKMMSLKGWTFVNNVPEDIRSFILIGAPHTSNWDFFAAMFAFRFLEQKNYNCRFMIKKEWTEFPFGLIMKPLGAYGLDRQKVAESKNTNTTDVMSSFFEQESNLVLAIAPEGTRKANSKWKTGFYHTAVKAGVPIVLGFVDYSQKICGLGKVLYPKDFEQDMHEIMKFYKKEWGKVSANYLSDERFTQKNL